KALAGALAGRTDLAVLVGEGVSAQQVVDIAVALRDRPFQLGAMTGTLAEREADYRAGGKTPKVAPLAKPGRADGSLDPQEVNRILVRSRAQTTTCYKQALATKPTIEGTVTARFTIDATGR